MLSNHEPQARGEQNNSDSLGGIWPSAVRIILLTARQGSHLVGDQPQAGAVATSLQLLPLNIRISCDEPAFVLSYG